MSASHHLESQEVKLIYQSLRATPLKDITNAKSEDMLKRIDSKGLNLNLETMSSLKLLGRIAHQCSETDFYDFVIENDLPPLKLTAQEMEMIKGGGWLKHMKRAFTFIKNNAGTIADVFEGLANSVELYDHLKPKEKK